MTPVEQRILGNRLIGAASKGYTETVRALLTAGADVHAEDDMALRWAADYGQTEMVRVLLAGGANVHAENDDALRWAAWNSHTETVRVLARHLFAPDLWRGKSRAEIEVEANALYEKVEAENPISERLHEAASILLDCALTCWEQVRPAPPKLTISALPAQPRPL